MGILLKISPLSLRGAIAEFTLSLSKGSNLKRMVMDKQYYIYIMTNAKHTALYTGVTNDLKRRVWEHKEKFVEGFTKRYHIDMLMYYEVCENVESAISREKQIKAGSRQKKINLINNINSEWLIYTRRFRLPRPDVIGTRNDKWDRMVAGEKNDIYREIKQSHS